jgi:hypothetical protein
MDAAIQSAAITALAAIAGSVIGRMRLNAAEKK